MSKSFNQPAYSGRKNERNNPFSLLLKADKERCILLPAPLCMFDLQTSSVILSETEAELPDVLSHTFLTAKFPSEMNLVHTGRFTKTGG